MKNTAVLLISCPDRKGIVASVANFLYENNANILHADEHQDSEQNLFFLRIEWDMDDFSLKPEEIEKTFIPVAAKFHMNWKIAYSLQKPRVALLVSHQDHCIVDLLYRHKTGELHCDIPLVISNHANAKSITEFYTIPFEEIQIEKEDKSSSEKKILSLLEKNTIDVLVLARYMQILSEDFIKAFSKPIINIHHSFLPAFIGAKPYHQAFERGVKIIGATAHYVTANLDCGPIIQQDILHVSHRESIDDLIQKGKDIEKIVLSRAVKNHIENRVLVYSNKTVVFD